MGQCRAVRDRTMNFLVLEATQLISRLAKLLASEEFIFCGFPALRIVSPRSMAFVALHLPNSEVLYLHPAPGIIV